MNYVKWLWAGALLFALSSGCKTQTSDYKGFNAVKEGMTRPEVDKILGRAVLDDRRMHESLATNREFASIIAKQGTQWSVFYGSGSKGQAWQSPNFISPIEIVYSNNIVIRKMFYGDK